MERKQYESLSIQEQARIFYESPFRDRGDLLLHSQEPAGLAQSLSPEELYLVTREMAPEDRSEIISYASLQQLLFLSDIECWKKDRISTTRFLHWMETLLAAGDERLMAWLTEMDYEMLIASLKKVLHVAKPDWDWRHEDQALQDRPTFTLDEYYHVFVKEENLETVKRVIECMYSYDRKRYVMLLEGVMAELDGEVEEDAYRLREKRLAERGFPDPETARRLFMPITQKEFEAFPLKEEAVPRAAAKDAREMPDYPMMWSEDRLFLDDVLLTFRDAPQAVQERIREELVWLSNKIIACDGIDFVSEDRIRKGLERTRRLVNIGLELLAGGDIALAHDVMRKRWLEIVLRWGLTRVLGLRGEAEAILKRTIHENGKAFLEFLEAPYENVMQGMFRTIPEFHDPAVPEEVFQLRDFRNTAEIESTRRMIREIAHAVAFLEKAKPGFFARVFLAGTPRTSLFAVLGTALVHGVTDGKLSVQPLAQRQVRAFLKGASGAARRRLFLEKFFPGDADAAALWTRVFEKVEDELGGIDPAEGIDTRYVTAVLIKKGGS